MDCSSSSKALFVFDFDNTIVDGNSDMWFLENLNQYQKIPEYRCWTDKMQYVFEGLHTRGYDQEAMTSLLREIKIFPSLLTACKAIAESDKAEAIIVSDANSYFIKFILEAHGLGHVFKEVITNSASFDEKGMLKITHHHNHTCPQCPANLCKKCALAPYQGLYRQVVYVGDGQNDVCPCLGLSADDIVIAREGFGLANILETSKDLKATLHVINFSNEAIATKVQEILA